MAELKKFELAETVRVKALELAGRAQVLASQAETQGEIEFAIAMLEESESAITCWTNELKKAARNG